MERTHERFLSGVNSHVIDQFILGFEWFVFSWTILPVTPMISVLWSSDVIHGEVVDNVVHGVEHLVADLPGVGVLPLAHRVHLAWLLLLRVSVVGIVACSNRS